MKKAMKVLVGATAPVVALGGVAAVTASPVQAASAGDYDGAGIAIRQNSTLSSPINGYGYRGQGLTANCYKSGDWVTRGSVSSNIWVNNNNWTTGVSGASSMLYLTFGPISAC